MEDLVSDSSTTRNRPSLDEIEVVGIDFDGVVIDSAPGIVQCMTEAFERRELRPPDAQAIKSIIGPPLEVGLAGLLERQSVDLGCVDDLVVEFRSIYQAQAPLLTSVYPGIIVEIGALQKSGRFVSLVTSKPRAMTERLLESLELERYFDRVECQGEGDSDKSDVLRRVLDATGADPGRVVMIGDRSHDVLAASAVGAVSIGVLWGYGSRDELLRAGVDHLVEEALELRLLVGV
jgi:phosphoglycolate phosphatase